MNNKTQMLKGILEGCVLQILEREACYSGMIVEKLRECGFRDISEGTLFPLLLRLENRELFEIERVKNPLGPSRKFYKLNAYGKEELKNFRAEWEEMKKITDAVLGGVDFNERKKETEETS